LATAAACAARAAACACNAAIRVAANALALAALLFAAGVGAVTDGGATGGDAVTDGVGVVFTIDDVRVAATGGVGTAAVVLSSVGSVATVVTTGATATGAALAGRRLGRGTAAATGAGTTGVGVGSVVTAGVVVAVVFDTVSVSSAADPPARSRFFSSINSANVLIRNDGPVVGGATGGATATPYTYSIGNVTRSNVGTWHLEWTWMDGWDDREGGNVNE
jgi:hypothetical protein